VPLSTSAFVLLADDDGTCMLGDATYRPATSSGFHDWRFGTGGVPHPATCGACGRKTNSEFVSPSFRVAHRRRDLLMTGDGYLLASKRLRDCCVAWTSPGAQFVTLPADDDFYWLRSDRVVTFDTVARGARFEKRCEACDAFYDVAGATPAILKEGASSLSNGFYRTDVEFGSGPEQCPLIIVAGATAAQVRAEKFRGLDLRAIAT